MPLTATSDPAGNVTGFVAVPIRAGRPIGASPIQRERANPIRSAGPVRARRGFPAPRCQERVTGASRRIADPRRRPCVGGCPRARTSVEFRGPCDRVPSVVELHPRAGSATGRGFLQGLPATQTPRRRDTNQTIGKTRSRLREPRANEQLEPRAVRLLEGDGLGAKSPSGQWEFWDRDTGTWIPRARWTGHT